MKCWGCLVGTRVTSFNHQSLTAFQPNWTFPYIARHSQTSVGCDELDILICRPLLVLFPLLGVPLCITELFQGPCQRLAVLWTLNPLIFCWSNYFKYQHSYHGSLWIGFGGSISTPGGYLRNLCVCARICYSGEEVRASTTFSKRFCDSEKD